MSFTYPAVGLDNTLTVPQVHYLLKNPALLARRVRDLALYGYIADFLLTGRFQAVAGAILYPNGEPIFTNDDPEAVGVGGEYPLTSVGSGTMAMAKTVKWGRDVEIYDEEIAALQMNPVNRALRNLVNSNIKYIDSVALGVIASKITRTHSAGAAWTSLTGSGEQIIEDVLLTKAETEELEDGFDLNTVVLKPTQYAKVVARLIAADLLPREAGNPVQATATFDYMGLTWATSAHSPVTDPLLLDREQLGGMADWNIQSPGYASGAGGVGIEVATWRLGGEGNRDGYRTRARRITVPVVVEPNAGVKITGTGI